MRKDDLFAEGRSAALFDPKAVCPYNEFVDVAAWKQGFAKGVEDNGRLSWDELAYARGWHAGFYAPAPPEENSFVCPYDNGDEIRYWQRGFTAGRIAAVDFAQKRTPNFATRSGRSAPEVTDPAEIERIRKAYKGNGGTMSYDQIEKEFGLRSCRGMTAYRIVNAGCHDGGNADEQG
jgi:ribosome modulation factor